MNGLICHFKTFSKYFYEFYMISALLIFMYKYLHPYFIHISNISLKSDHQYKFIDILMVDQNEREGKGYWILVGH